MEELGVGRRVLLFFVATCFRTEADERNAILAEVANPLSKLGYTRCCRVPGAKNAPWALVLQTLWGWWGETCGKQTPWIHVEWLNYHPFWILLGQSLGPHLTSMLDTLDGQLLGRSPLLSGSTWSTRIDCFEKVPFPFLPRCGADGPRFQRWGCLGPGESRDWAFVCSIQFCGMDESEVLSLILCGFLWLKRKQQELLQLTKVFLLTEAGIEGRGDQWLWPGLAEGQDSQNREPLCQIVLLNQETTTAQNPWSLSGSRSKNPVARSWLLPMPRFVIPGDPIEVAYGYEDDPGLANVFLSVYDKRLMYDGTAAKEVNEVTRKVGPGTGSGSYFELRTGRFGFGTQVDDQTMAVYLKRFGVPQEQIESLPLRVPKPHVASGLARARAGACPMCQKAATKKCGKCGSRAYCSDTCQREEWKIHKIFCALHPFPCKPAGRYVTAMLLPEKEKQPRIVHVELETHQDEDGDTYVMPCVRPFLGEAFSRSLQSDLLPGYPMRHLTQPIHVAHRDAFLIDGSAENSCVANLFGALYNGESLGASHASLWCGPLVAFKSMPTPTIGPMDPEFVDLEMADLHDVLEFLRQYGLASMSAH